MERFNAPEDLDADSLVDFDIKLMTNESHPFSVAEIVNEYQKVEIVDVDANSDDDKDDCPDDDPVSPPSQFEIEDTIETLKKLRCLRKTQSLILYCRKCQLRSTIEDWLIGNRPKSWTFMRKNDIKNFVTLVLHKNNTLFLKCYASFYPQNITTLIIYSAVNTSPPKFDRERSNSYKSKLMYFEQTLNLLEDSNYMSSTVFVKVAATRSFQIVHRTNVDRT